MGTFGYIRSFDGIRGIAVAVVVAKHLSYGIVPGGWIGVDLFFLLSGFLITSILFAESEASESIALGNFYLKRLLRLAAPLVLSLLIGNLIWIPMSAASVADRGISTLGSLFYLSNLLQESLLGPFPHLWSLSVEEHFYVLWPLLVSAVLLKLDFGGQVFLAVVLIVIATVLRLYLADHEIAFGPFVIDAYRFSFARMDNLLIGCVLAIVGRKRNLKIFRDGLALDAMVCGSLAVLAAILITVSSYSSGWRNGGFILTNAACLALVFLAINSPENKILVNRYLRWIGQRSYGIYVYHYPIMLATEGYRVHHGLANLALVTSVRLILFVVVAQLSFVYMEKPLMRLKAKFYRHPVGGSLLQPLSP